MAQTIISEYLERIHHVIASGHYKDNWASLVEYPIPNWYKNAKFGIFIHWGAFSVPAFGEWYARTMYLKGSESYEYHVKNYGDPKDFGYEDFIPLFKAERFDPKAWIELFKKAGARYVMPTAEHHDGFQMYDSMLSEWNAAKMGPRRDILGELKREAEAQGLIFAASSHRAENFWFFGGCRDFDSGLQDITFQEPYGFADPMYSSQENLTEKTNDIYTPGPSKEHLEDWLVRSCEIVDTYQPKIVWFDWWIQNLAFKPYLKKFAAYYYNRSLEWNVPLAINYKEDAFAYGTAVFDIERGQSESIRPQFWQTDTAISRKTWGYSHDNEFKTAKELICDLIDIVSKNGSLLLNVGPKSDGTISPEETAILEQIGEWLRINGEAIYDTRFWKVFGEGPTNVTGGSMNEKNRLRYTSEDIRFTYHAPYLYAHVLKWPDNNRVRIRSLAPDSKIMNGHIEAVELLGSNAEVNMKRSRTYVEFSSAENINSEFPICLKIKID